MLRRSSVLLRRTNLELKVVLILEVLDYDSPWPPCTFMLVDILIEARKHWVCPAFPSIENELRWNGLRSILLALRQPRWRLGHLLAFGTQLWLEVR